MSNIDAKPVIFAFADYELDVESGVLTRRGQRIRLQDQPLRLLALLLSQAGTVVTREHIREHLWPGDTYVEFDQSLRVAVNKLREALRDPATSPSFVETVPRRGYRFIAPVTEIAPAASGVSKPDSAADDAETGVVAVAPATSPMPAGLAGQRGWRRWIWIPGLPLVLVAGILAASFWTGHHKPGEEASTVAAHPAPRRAVAVIGLRDLRGDTRDRWLSAALREMLSSELSASDRLRVISGEEVARAGLYEPPANTPSHDSLARYARQLGADMIVCGSYTVTRSAGSPGASQIRIDLQLDNLTSDAPELTVVETSPGNDLFSLVSTSGTQLRERLGLEEPSAEASKAVRKTLPADPAASQFYAEGLNRLRGFDALGARDLLEKAAHIEPRHAGTHMALADAWNLLGYDAEARSEATRAVELGADLPREELLTMQGQLALFSNDWQHATDVFRSLYTFYPDDVDYGLRLVQAQNGGSHSPDALATIAELRSRRLQRADDARVDVAEAGTGLVLGDFRKAEDAANRAIQLGIDLDQNPVRAQALWLKASSLERQGKSQESLAASAESQSLYRIAGDRRGQGIALLISGDVLYDRSQTAEARKSFEAALDQFRETGNRKNIASAEERIGNTFFEEGTFPQSLAHYRQALQIYSDLHWDAAVASATGNIANVEAVEGKTDAAIDSNQHVLELFEKSGVKRGMASTLVNLGELELERGGLEQAAADYRHAEGIDREIAYQRGIVDSLDGEGDVLLERGDTAGAKQRLVEALAQAKGLDEPSVLGPLQISLGIAALVARDPDALAHFQSGLDLAIKDGDHGEAAIALAWMARSEQARGRLPNALDAANRSVAEAQKQFAPRPRAIAALAHARALIAGGETAQGRREIQSAIETVRGDNYSPLVFEGRILLARSDPIAGERDSQTKALEREAESHHWKRLEAEARTR